MTRYRLSVTAPILLIGLLWGVPVQAQWSLIDTLLTRAERGIADAQFNLAVRYDFGEGVSEDATEAARWYRLAAEQGHADAQFNLAVSYDFGEGVSEDATEAIRWYRLAAEQGHADAQFNLGVSYADGEGVSKDAVQAYMWLDLAAARGTGEQREEAARLRDLTADAVMTPEQIAKAQRLAREWETAHPR